MVRHSRGRAPNRRHRGLAPPRIDASFHLKPINHPGERTNCRLRVTATIDKGRSQTLKATQQDNLSSWSCRSLRIRASSSFGVASAALPAGTQEPEFGSSVRSIFPPGARDLRRKVGAIEGLRPERSSHRFCQGGSFPRAPSGLTLTTLSAPHRAPTAPTLSRSDRHPAAIGSPHACLDV